MFVEPMNITGFNGVLSYVNTSTEGMFAYALIVMVFLIVLLFVASERFSFKDALLSSLFITTLLALLLRVLLPINDLVLYALMVGFGFAVLIRTVG